MSNLEIDQIDRTSSVGLFNFANSYFAAALALKDIRIAATHPETPLRFLYFHAVELFLKAYLRGKGHSAAELRSRKFGHRICCLSERAAQYGLKFGERDIQVFSWMSCTDAVIESRYIVVGLKREIPCSALEQTCRSLRELVRLSGAVSL